MMKLNISNLNGFLQTVNRCSGPVNIVNPDGTKQDIRNRLDLEVRYRQAYRDNRNSLPLWVEVPEPKDYMRLVYFYIGDN